MLTRQQIHALCPSSTFLTDQSFQQCYISLKEIAQACYDESGEQLIKVNEFFLKILNLYIFARTLGWESGRTESQFFLDIVKKIIYQNLPAFFAQKNKKEIIGTFDQLLAKGVLTEKLISYFSTAIAQLVKELANREITTEEVNLINYFFYNCFQGNKTNFFNDRREFIPTPALTKILENLRERAATSQKIYYLVEKLDTLYDHNSRIAKNQSLLPALLPKFLSFKKEEKQSSKTAVTGVEKIMSVGYCYLLHIMPKEVAFLAAVAYISDFYLSNEINISKSLISAEDMGELIEKWSATPMGFSFLGSFSTQPVKENFARIKSDITDFIKGHMFSSLISPSFKQDCKQTVKDLKNLTEVQKWLKKAKTDICNPANESRPELRIALSQISQLEYTVRQAIQEQSQPPPPLSLTTSGMM